jgi:hypothetical protein
MTAHRVLDDGRVEDRTTTLAELAQAGQDPILHFAVSDVDQPGWPAHRHRAI